MRSFDLRDIQAIEVFHANSISDVVIYEVLLMKLPENERGDLRLEFLHHGVVVVGDVRVQRLHILKLENELVIKLPMQDVI